MGLEEREDIPLPGELDAEEESPYLRRQKAVAVRRARFSRRVRWILLGSLVFLPLGLVGCYLAVLALASPLFMSNSAEDILVEGNQYVSREEVVNALGLPATGTTRFGLNIFRLSLEEKRKQVESIPWVRSASLTRAVPHGLGVYVVERAPVAFVNVGGRLKLVDDEGVILEKPEKAAFDFPVLTGLDAAVSRNQRRLLLALFRDFEAQVAGEAARSGWLISEVDLSDADDLKALVVHERETIQVRFGNQNFLDGFRNFLALLPELHKTIAKIDAVDLRYHNQLVVNPQPAGTRATAGRDCEPARGHRVHRPTQKE